MQNLIEKDAICELKARYFRGLDTKDWELFSSTMTEDVKGRYSGGQLSFEDRETLVQFMVENLSLGTTVTMHHGHHPEVSISDDGETATGVWYLQDMVIDLVGKTRLYGSAIYKDEYRKVDGEWKISLTGYHRIFEFVEPLADGHIELQSMFAQ